MWLCIVNVYAQGGGSDWAKSFSETADDAFKAELYFDAIELYNRAFQKSKGNKIERQRIYFQIGICYRNIANYREAETWLEKAKKYGHLDPLLILYLADAKKYNNQFEEALKLYEKYVKKLPDDPLGKLGLESCKLAMKWMEEESRFEVNKIKVFNSSSDDFAPSYGKKNYRVLYFTSSRPAATGNEVDGTSGQDFSDVFFSIQDRKKKWSAPKKVEGGINTELNEGAASFNKKFQKIYFTTCLKNKKENMGSQIYWAASKGTRWGEAEVIKIAHDSIVVTHPAMAQDDKTLYFSSNMRGTLGGMDLWVQVYDKKTKIWSKPRNLGPNINTAGNEQYPVVRKNGEIYFSSDGLPGMGGLDIFKTTRTSDSTFSDPVNLKYPINTPRDDFGITFEKYADNGFLSSNRIGGKGGDDIYEFNMPPIEVFLDGHVRDDATQEIIEGAIVELRGSDGSVAIDTVGRDGYYKFPLKNDVDYEIEIKKKDFLAGFTRISTKGIMKSKTIQPESSLGLVNTKAPINLPRIDYEMSDSVFKPESKEDLLKLVEILNKYPKMKIELRSHTDYSGSTGDNKALSQKRAQSVVDFLVAEGIASERLKPVGSGESSPLTVSKKVAEETAFHEGDVLTEKFLGPITRKGDKKWDEGMQLNRRTEFFILNME